MEMPTTEVVKEIPGHVRTYTRVQKLAGTAIVPCGVDPSTGVNSNDVLISTETSLCVRFYIPNSTTKKLPLVIFFHGGGFIIESAKSPTYHKFLNLVSFESNVVVVSVDYRTAPEHPVPVCYEDSWDAIKWVALHVDGNGPNSCLNQNVDFGHLFFAGDSAGGNIAHQMAIRVGSDDININLTGLILLCPYFWGNDPIGSESLDNPQKAIVTDVWFFACPGTSGLDDPLFNPDKDTNVSKIHCSRVLVCVAELDVLKDRGWFYKDILAKNGVKADIHVTEYKGVKHVFFLISYDENATDLRNRISAFINHN